MSSQALFPRIVAAHHKLEQMVTQVEVEVDQDEARRAVRALLSFMAPHMVAEEEVVFPAIQERAVEEEARVMLLQAFMDHEVIWDLARRMQDPEAGLDEMKAHARAVNKLLVAHMEEEERDILYIARQVLTYAEFAHMAKEVQDRQDELIDEVRRRRAGAQQDAVGDLYRELGDWERRTRYVRHPSR